jgi:hypothetical protein
MQEFATAGRLLPRTPSVSLRSGVLRLRIEDWCFYFETSMAVGFRAWIVVVSKPWVSWIKIIQALVSAKVLFPTTPAGRRSSFIIDQNSGKRPHTASRAKTRQPVYVSTRVSNDAPGQKEVGFRLAQPSGR